MDNPIAITLSGQSALARRLETIAQNVANATTAGYRAEGISFSTLVRSAGEAHLAFATSGDSFISSEAGAMVETGNPLDVAITGDAFISHGSASGPVYTRDGRMAISAVGTLVSLGGDPVLDAGGAPIQVNPSGGPISIARDGMITQSGRQIGAIGLFRFDPEATLTRASNVAFTVGQAAEPVLDFTTTAVTQFFIEGANVNPMTELARLITVTRAFETAQNALRTTEESAQAGLRALTSDN